MLTSPLRKVSIDRSPPRLLRVILLVGFFFTLPTVTGVLDAQDFEPAEQDPGEFTVVEVEVTGLDALDPPVNLPRRLPLREGVEYTSELVSLTGRVISEAFSERGRPYAVVVGGADLDREDRSARVTLTVVDPGPVVHFGDVTVHADSPLQERDVRERLTFVPGDVFRPSQLEWSRASLELLPVVQSATVVPRGLDAGEVTIRPEVHVTAVPRPRAPQVSGSVSSVRCLELFGTWRDRYFLGGPRAFTLSGGLGNLLASQLEGRFPCAGTGEGEVARTNYLLHATYAQSWPGDPLGTVSVEAFGRRESRAEAFVVEGFGGRVSYDRPLTPSVWGSMSYTAESTRIRAAGFFYCVNQGACTREEIRSLAAARWLSPLEGRVRWVPGAGVTGAAAVPGGPSLLGQVPISPWRTWVEARAQVAGGPTGSDHAYGSVELEGATARLLGRATEGAGRAIVGGLRRGTEALPPHVRLYGGGVGSVRGIPQNLLGPRVLLVAPDHVEDLGCAPVAQGCPEDIRADPDLVLVRPRGGDVRLEASVEGRLRVARQVQLAAFLDAGTLRAESAALIDGGGGGGWDAVVTPGLGIRVDTMIGFFRLDVGFDPRGGARIPILTEEADSGDLIHLGEAWWNPYTHDDPGTLWEFFRRLNWTIGMGQPF